MEHDRTSDAGRQRLSLRALPQIAFEGLIGNAIWAILALVAVAIAASLEGTVSAWFFSITTVLLLAVSAFIATALVKRAERLRGARDEARQQAADAVARAIEIEERSEAEKRELREQLAAVGDGKQAVSTKMQSIVRQVEALASTPTGYADGPNESQVELFSGLIEDFARIAPDQDPLVQKLIDAWKEPLREHNDADWQSALQVLKARAISLGAEEALGQQH